MGRVLLGRVLLQGARFKDDGGGGGDDDGDEDAMLQCRGYGCT
jgi:hypothetical protein